MWRLHRERELREIQVVARVAVPDPSVHHQLALKGVGIAMLGQAEVFADLKERRLVRLLPEWEPEPIELYALHPSRLPLRRRSKLCWSSWANTVTEFTNPNLSPVKTRLRSAMAHARSPPSAQFNR
jgi:DNA-binding transcriptional LysR family regulator